MFLKIKNLLNPSIDSLINELLLNTNSIFSHSNVSSESKSIISIMRKHIEELRKANSPKVSEQIVTAWAGAMIYVLTFEDQKYAYRGDKERHYPEKTLGQLDKQYKAETNIVEEADSDIAFMYWLGSKALSNQIPFDSNRLKIKITNYNNQPVLVFPKFDANTDNVDKLISPVKLLIKYRHSYLSGFIRGATEKLFTLTKPALPRDITNIIAGYMDKTNSHANKMGVIRKEVTFFAKDKAMEVKEIEESSLLDKSVTSSSLFAELTKNTPLLKK